MLKSLVTKSISEYFHSDQWNSLMNILNRKTDVRHAHIYTESILHPYDMAKIIQQYFQKCGYTLQRKITFLSHGRGYSNIYYIHPHPDMAHFELFMNYNDDVVIGPADESKTRAGQNVEFWDDKFMQEYYANFSFRQPNKHEEEEIIHFFETEHWRQACDFMTNNGVHSHVPVTTCIHPETLMKLGIRAIEAKRWSVARAVSVVYSLKGYDQGKITFLLKKPEIVLELDWEFNENTLIQPRGNSLILAMDTDVLAKDLHGIPYYRLEQEDINNIVGKI